MVTNGKRVAYGRNQNRVNESTYPDDTSVPVRTSHWNSDPSDQAILGFTKVTATLDINGELSTKDDTSTFVEADGNTYSRQSTVIEVECNGTLTTDSVDTISLTDTNENDILYLFKGTGTDTVTITHTASPTLAGQIVCLDSAGATLNSTGRPIMLIKRGNYWYEFGGGGGSINAINDIGDVTITTPADNEVLAYDTASTSWINQTVTEAGLASAVHTHSQSDVTNLTTDLAGKSPLAGNTSLVTTGTITTGTWNGTSISLTNGGTGATSQQAGIDALTAVSGATNEHVLTKDTATGNAIWKAASGGASAEVNSILQANSYTASNASPTTEGTDQVSIWVETIDANNQGVYARIKKNGSYVNVQIA